MTSTDIAARSLDVFARSIDLPTSLAVTANSPHSVVRVGMELGRWLGREKLNEHELHFCLEKASGLVIANSKGNQFYQAVVTGSRVRAHRAVGPLFAQPSGALGRLMANDPHLCWITSTIACLFEFHGENFICDVLCSFIMSAHLSKNGEPVREHQLAWDPMRLQLKLVLEKMVSSIWFNVVNSGVVRSGELGSTESLPLPQALKDVCPRGHNIESHTLGVVLNQLRTPRPEVIIESDHILSNLTLWLIYHFNGRLRVIVSSRIVYDEVLGRDGCTIELRVRNFCGASRPCDSGKSVPFFRIYLTVAGRPEGLFSGKYDTQMTLEQSPRVRQKLYQPVKYPLGSAGKESMKTLARQTAYKVVNWLLNLPVSRETSSNELSFNINLDGGVIGKDTKLTVADLLARIPSITNMGWGDLSAATVVFSVPVDNRTPITVDNFLDADSDEGEENSILSEFDREDSDGATPEYILRHFPILRDLLQEVKKSCRCPYCKKPDQRSKLKPGCLQHTVFMEVMTYIAHSIADAFGADDTSACLPHKLDDLDVLEILYDVIGGSLKWRNWLSTASRVVLGCPSIEALIHTEVDEDYSAKSDFVDAQDLSSSVVAVQHGNLAVIAPWLEIRESLTVKHCFAFKIVQGRLGITVNDGSPEAHFQVLQGDSAVIETQYTENSQSYVDKFAKNPEEVGARVRIQPDTSNLKMDYILVSAGSSRYKLLTRVVSDSHSRLIDPARVMIKVSQPELLVHCEHPVHQCTGALATTPALKLYSFDELLGRWPNAKKEDFADSFNPPRHTAQEWKDEEDFPAGQYHRLRTGNTPDTSDGFPTLRVSHILDSHLKFNIALALAFDDVTLISHETACLGCTIEKAKTVDAANGIENSDRSRWVIFRSKTSDRGTSTGSHQGVSRKRILS